MKKKKKKGIILISIKNIQKKLYQRRLNKLTTMTTKKKK